MSPLIQCAWEKYQAKVLIKCSESTYGIWGLKSFINFFHSYQQFYLLWDIQQLSFRGYLRSSNGFLWNEHVCCKICAKIKCQWESYPYVAYLKISVRFSLLLSFTFSGTWILQKRSPIDGKMLFPFPSVYQDHIHGPANGFSPFCLHSAVLLLIWVSRAGDQAKKIYFKFFKIASCSVCPCKSKLQISFYLYVRLSLGPIVEKVYLESKRANKWMCPGRQST